MSRPKHLTPSSPRYAQNLLHLSDGKVTTSMVTDAYDMASSAAKTLATVRAALHRVGDSTPAWAGWEELPVQSLTIRDAQAPATV